MVLPVVSIWLALVLAATTQFAQSVGAIKATSLKLRTNPKADLRLTKRDYITTTFRPDNETVFGFYVDVLVGTPPQFFSLAFSTGSTTWLPAPKNTTVKKFCDSNATGNSFWSCYYKNFFNSNASSTFTARRGVLDNYYGTGLFAKGTWGSDVFKINQLTIPNVYFGLATNFTNAAELGLGVERPRILSPYPSIPEAMVSSGAINSILYSIYVNDIRNDGGEIFFGAVDEAKYEGALTTYGSNTVGQVPITGVYWIAPDGTNTSLTSSVLAPARQVGEIQLGTPSLWLPNDIYTALVNMIPVLTYATAYDAYIVDCGIDDAQLGTLQFDLDGAVISVNARQMLVEYPTGSGNCVFTSYQTEKSSSSSPDYLLGTPFLRSAFTVFDYTNNRTSVAQSVQNSTSSTLMEVPEGGIEALPQPSGNPSGGTPTNTVGSATSLPTISSEPTSPSPTVVSGSSNGPNIGAIVGGTVGGVLALAIAGVILWFCVFKKRGSKEPDMPFPPEQSEQMSRPPDGVPKDEGYVTQTPAPYYGTSNSVPPQIPPMSPMQHSYGIPPATPVQTHPPMNSPPSSYHENWGHSGFGITPTNNNRPASVISGSTAGSGHGYMGTDLSSYGGHPGQSGGMPSPSLNAQGVYGNYGYSGYNQY